MGFDTNVGQYLNFQMNAEADPGYLFANPNGAESIYRKLHVSGAHFLIHVRCCNSNPSDGVPLRSREKPTRITVQKPYLQTLADRTRFLKVRKRERERERAGAIFGIAFLLCLWLYILIIRVPYGLLVFIGYLSNQPI